MEKGAFNFEEELRKFQEGFGYPSGKWPAVINCKNCGKTIPGALEKDLCPQCWHKENK